jgi:hypothetical protein
MGLNLPKIYLNEGGKYPQHLGKPKISYSQINSFKDYTLGYIQGYILGIQTDSGIFATFGSYCGDYISEGIPNEYLSKSDISILDSIEEPEGALYESEVVIDRGEYVIQGFSDREWQKDGLLFIDDFKTGNKDSMIEKYGDLQKYFQTRLYAYQREIEGFKIGGCKVIHLGRKGNTFDKISVNNKTGLPLPFLKLSGEIDYIETPYKTKDVENYLKTVDKTVKEISELKTTFDKFFKN